MNLIAICESLLIRNKIDAFLKRMAAGDEKLRQLQSKTILIELLYRYVMEGLMTF